MHCDRWQYLGFSCNRFTKNLSPNKISLKFLKGEGELHNLELNEKILTELLELPPWLRLTKAVCNKISAKVRIRVYIQTQCHYLPAGNIYRTFLATLVCFFYKWDEKCSRIPQVFHCVCSVSTEILTDHEWIFSV